MTPKITIIMATYNRAHFIVETLKSIQAQTYTNWECIIVDDGGTDNTLEVITPVLENDKRFIFLNRTETYKKGLPGCRNYGLDLALKFEADYIQFFDDDDIMHPEKLSKQIALFIANKELEIVNCKYQGFSGQFSLEDHIYIGDMNIDTNKLAEDFLKKNVRINSLGPIFKAELLNDIRFDTEMNFCAEETEFYLRLFFLKKPKYGTVNEFLFFYRHHKNSITTKDKNIIQKTGSIIRMYQKNSRFLCDNDLHTKQSMAFYINYFMVRYFEISELEVLFNYIKSGNKISNLYFFRIKTLFTLHLFYRKLIYKLLAI